MGIGSILQDRKECFITGSTENLHKHHIFGGNPGRKLSEEYGCWVYLRGEYHNLSKKGVHFDKELDLELKRMAQRAFEERWGHEKFMEVFGKNYLD